jgi:hypothetical protein
MTETSQAGMFALGTPSHAYLEFDAHEGAGPRLVTAIASLREPRTTMGGVNLVTGRIGPTSVYAFMQNVGVINDHVHGCFRATDYPRSRARPDTRHHSSVLNAADNQT